MTRKSQNRMDSSNVVSFPHTLSDVRGGGRSAPRAQQNRALLARPARLDPSMLDRQSLRLVTVLADPEVRGRLDEATAQVTLIGRKSGVSLALGQTTQTLAEALCKIFWLKREQEAKTVFYVATPLARQALAAAPLARLDEGPQEPAPRLINQKESPLLWLARRKNAQGIAHVSPMQLMAGERLRQDYTQAGMTPKMTANWSGLPVAGPVSGLGLTESERMLDARQRLRSALEACGSAQADLLLDLCCFLKPLEQVERERGWRARTGKHALVQALTRLARHYGLSETAHGLVRAKEITVWKADRDLS